MPTLTLLLPGLLGPDLPHARRAEAAEAVAGDLRLPALSRMLARTEPVGSDTGLDRALFECAGIACGADSDVPAAAVALLGEDGEPGDGYWLRVDPVHLQTDLTDLVLVDPSMLRIEVREAMQLCAVLDAHFEPDGLHFEPHAPQRWYLRLPEPARMLTRAPAELAGQPVSGALPTGEAGPAWHARMNEAQMVLHGCPVNVERAAGGLLTINSIWPWGGGPLPARPAPGAVESISGGGALGRGLARLTGAGWEPAPDSLGGLAGAGSTVVVLEDAGVPARSTDVEGWRTALTGFESRWFGPAERALRSGRFHAVELWAERLGRVRLNRAGARRFWRRPRPLARLLDAYTASRRVHSSP